MLQDRVKQIIATGIAITSVTAGGFMLPSILQEAEDNTLRYTNNIVNGVPSCLAFFNPSKVYERE